MENSEKNLQKYANEAAVPLEKISTKTREGSGEIPDCWWYCVLGNENSFNKDWNICQNVSLVVGAAQQLNNSAIALQLLDSVQLSHGLRAI